MKTRINFDSIKSAAFKFWARFTTWNKNMFRCGFYAFTLAALFGQFVILLELFGAGVAFAYIGSKLVSQILLCESVLAGWVGGEFICDWLDRRNSNIATTE
jgi:hypothetical protein